MSHMERVGVRELRRDASAILRRAAAGETIEVTDRGRPVAVIVASAYSGLARLEREGLLRRGRGAVHTIRPIARRLDQDAPSVLVDQGRAE